MQASGAAFSALRPRVSEALLATLGEHGFEASTPVQEATIPRLLKHQDVVVQAATGSGKTIAFLVPLFEVLGRREDPLRTHQVGALVIEPTRELAVQVHTVAQQLSSAQPATSLALVVGGTDIHANMAALRNDGAHVLIGTPGRLDDLMERLPELSFKELELLILDEADRTQPAPSAAWPRRQRGRRQCGRRQRGGVPCAAARRAVCTLSRVQACSTWALR
jgi:ATP-dependent RNA helicase DDX55/SPB4